MIAIFCNNNLANYGRSGKSGFLGCAHGCKGDTALFFSNRLIFADPPAPGGGTSRPGGGAEGDGTKGSGAPGGTEAATKPVEITLENLSDKLLDLMDQGKLQEKLVDEALKVVESGSVDFKQKILKATQDFSESKIGENTFRGIIKREVKAAGGAVPETAKVAETAGAPEAAEVDKKVEGVREETSQSIGDMLKTAEKMEESVKGQTGGNPENLKKIHKFSEDLKRLHESDRQNAQKTKTLLDKLVADKVLTREKADNIYNFNLEGLTGNKIQKLLDKFVADGALTPDQAEKINNLNLQGLPGKKIQGRLDELVVKKELSREQSGKIFNGIKKEGDNEQSWNDLIKNVSTGKNREEFSELKKLKFAEAKSEEEFGKAMHSFREIMKSMSDDVMVLAEREKAIKTLSLAAGVPIVAGQVLTYMEFDESKEKGFQYTKRPATIKGVFFAPRESIYGKYGEETSALQTSHVPVVTVEAYDPVTNRMKEEQFGYSNFLLWVDRQSVIEDIKSKKEMEESIKETVKEGDIFEYRFITDAVEKKAEDIQVKVEKIFEGKDEHGMDTTMIKLDREVVVAPTSSARRDTISIGEFAKWFKRNEAMKPVDSVEKLRAALKVHNEALNKQYPDRNPKHYPPIQVVQDEILKRPDNSGNTFVISEITDKEIKLSDGNKFSFASFLRWVQKNEIEKVDAAAEAEQETAFIEDVAEREAEKALLLAAKNQKNKGRLDDAHSGHDGREHGKHHGHSEDPSQFSAHYLRRLWNDTQFITPHNLFEMGKTIWEFIKRKLKRREQGAIGVVGEQMFGPLWTELGAEFKGVAQHAENEEVEHHAKHYRTMGMEHVKHELHVAPNKDILKAAITVLAEKGQMRWDDPEFHKSINRLANGSPCWVRESTHLENIEKILDSWFGNDTFREFRNKQDSSYNSVKKNFEDHAKRLEGDPERNGGLEGALKSLLYKHLHGEYVNPAQYEEYLHWAIFAGKLSFEAKLFYLMMGIGAPSKGAGGHPGQTLLHIDRVGALEGELLRNFPILDFFTSPSFTEYDSDGNPVPEIDPTTGGPAIDPTTGQPLYKKAKITIRHFQDWVQDIIEKDLGVSSLSQITSMEQLKPEKGYEYIGQLLREEIAWNPAALERISKASGNPKDWDHDDMDVFGPMLGEESVFNLLARQGGASQNVTNEGVKNVYVGFNNFTKIKMDMLKRDLKAGNSASTQKDIRDITNLMRSFVRFDAMCADRYDHGQVRVRFGDQEFNAIPICDRSRTVRQQQKEMHAFIGGLARELGLEKDWKIVSKNVGKAPAQGIKDEQQRTVGAFGSKLEGAFKTLSPQQLSALFAKIQKENEGSGLNVKGILQKPKSRSEGEKVSAEMLKLQPYTNEELLGKVEQIRELQREKELPPLTDVQKEAKLKKIISLVEAERFTELDTKKDGALLDEEIGRLQQQAGQKKSGQKKGGQKKAT